MTNVNAIVKHEQMSLDDLQRTAKLLALSGYFDAKGNGDQAIAQIATKILAGAELGYGPFAAVNGLHIIQGKPTISANLMAAAVKGHPKYDYRVKQMDDTAVCIEFFQGNQSLGISAFTLEDARKAKTQNLDKFPRNMLFARAMSNGVRWYCPDVFSGNTVYTPEEFDADSTAEPVAVRVVNQTTGEIIEHRNPSNGNGQSDDEMLPAMVAGWMETNNPAEAAKSWSIESGICKETTHAKNALQRVVDEQFAGVFKRSNMALVLTAFYRDRIAKKHENEAVATVTVEEAEPQVF